MGSITDFLEKELLDHVFNAGYTAPTNIYLVLCIADPTDAATGGSCQETADSNGYQRTEITVGAAASRVVTQDADVEFPQATGDWASTITHWCIADNSGYGLGNILAHGAFETGKDITDGDTPKVSSGEVYVQFDAGEITDYLANELLDHVFNNAAYSSPDTYLALYTTDNSDSTPGTEVSGGGYARKQINPNGGAAPDWNLAAGTTPATVDNNDDVDIGPATADWGTVVSIGIMDALSGGNQLMYDNGMTDKPVGDGDTAHFAAGDLDMQAA